MDTLVLKAQKPKFKSKVAERHSTDNLPPLDSFDMVIVPLSSGKDSQEAANIALERFGRDKVRFVYCMVDTEASDEAIWEHPFDRAHIDYLETVLGPIDRVTVINPTHSRRADDNNPEKGLTSIILQHTFQPGANMPYCTKSKVSAMNEWAKQFEGRTVLWVLGQRAEESKNRAELPEYGYDKDSKRYCWRPVHKYTAQQIFDAIFARRQKVNYVYNLGLNHGGNCKICIHAPKSEVRQMVKLYPLAARRFVNEIELKVGPRRDYSVAQAIADVELEANNPGFFTEEDYLEMEGKELRKDACGLASSWYSCGE